MPLTLIIDISAGCAPTGMIAKIISKKAQRSCDNKQSSFIFMEVTLRLLLFSRDLRVILISYFSLAKRYIKDS